MSNFANTKLLLLLLTAITAVGCGNVTNQTASQGRQWKIHLVAKTNVETITRYSASIQGCQDVEIRPQVSGVIEAVHISEGENVRKGQTLFVIDQVPFRAALNEAISNVKAAKAALATARLNYESKQRLFAEKVISEYELLASENGFHSAEAGLAQSEAAEASARNNFSYTEVKSPVNGVVGVLPYRQGALVSPNIAQPLTSVSDNSQMYVYFSVGENQALAMMREWGTMEETLRNMDEVELLLGDGSLYARKGKVESISGIVDRKTGSVALRAVFDNTDKLLLSGSMGNIQITNQNNDVVAIPQSATVKIQDKYLVYKVLDGKAQSAQISVAPSNNGIDYIVLSGLAAGDVIVADGVGLVREGMEINTK